MGQADLKIISIVNIEPTPYARGMYNNANVMLKCLRFDGTSRNQAIALQVSMLFIVDIQVSDLFNILIAP
jgi:hypothetical protein